MGGPSQKAVKQEAWLPRHQEILELLPAGWTIVDHRLIPIDTPAGYLVWRQEVLVRCSRCRRRTPVDLEDLAHSRLARQPLAAAVEALRCQHWRGCGLELQPPIYPASAPLISLVALGNVQV